MKREAQEDRNSAEQSPRPSGGQMRPHGYLGGDHGRSEPESRCRVGARLHRSHPRYTPGLLFVNRSSWAHCVAEVARVLDLSRERLLTAAECEALDGRRSPHGVITPAIALDGALP